MKISQMMPSSYLKQDDIGEGKLVTIERLEKTNVAQADDPPENKWVMHFSEFEKGLVMNSTNIQLAAKACGSDDTDDWIGQQIVLYVDPNVSYGGKLVGGIRIRARRKPAAGEETPRKPAARPVDELADDIPF